MHAVKALPADGRHARTVRTRQAILKALLDLIEEGNTEPTAPQLAKRAGVAERSIRQHFASREALFTAAVETFNARLAPAAEPGTFDPKRPRAERLAVFVELRARELEACAPIRRAAQFANRASAIGRATDGAWQRRRREVARAFAPELAARSDSKSLLDALDLLAHGQTWDTMRETLRLSFAEARALLAGQVAAALRVK